MIKSKSGASENKRNESMARKALPTAAKPVNHLSGFGSSEAAVDTSARPDQNRLHPYVVREFASSFVQTDLYREYFVR